MTHFTDGEKHKKFLKSNWPILLIIFVSALMGILRFNSFQVGGFQDDAHYVVLAESLANEQGYALINYPGGRPELNFPPGWPLLLAPITDLFPGNYTVLKVFSFLLWLMSIALIYRFFAKQIDEPYLTFLIALIALNPDLIGLSGMLMSEMAFIFCTLLVLNVFDFWNDNRAKASDWILVLVAMTALYAQAIRTAGIAIVIAIVAYLFVKRHFRQLGIVLIVFAIGLTITFWFNSQNGGGLIASGYQQQVLGNSSFTTKVTQMFQNAQDYSDGKISNTLIPILGPKVTTYLEQLNLGFISLIANIGILLIVLLGIILRVPSYNLSDLYVGMYFLGILTFWNPAVGSTQTRFLLPIIPFLYFYLLNGLIWMANLILRQNKRHVFATITLISSLMMLISVGRNLQDWRNPVRYRITDISIGRIWLQENSSPDAIVMVRNPVPDYLYLRRRTVSYPKDGQHINEYIRKEEIDYILLSPELQTPRNSQLDDFTKNEILPMIQSNPGTFDLVFENATEAVFIYRVNH